MIAEIYLCATWSDGSVSHEAMQIVGRFPSQPQESGWRLVADDGTWVRATSKRNCEEYLARVAQRVLELDGLTMTGWRRITASEHEVFTQAGPYRNALEDVGGVLKHNMVKARELHRAALRHQNGDKFMTLDHQWVNASAAGDAKGADDVEAKRKMLRDFVNDPRIEAAQTLDELKQIVPPEG